MRRFTTDLAMLRQLMVTTGLMFLQPQDLGEIPSSQELELAIVGNMRKYELGVFDATILLEAERAGITSVVSMDADMHRAQKDFDVYTWL